ncbi:MAG: hypothetical protein DRJ03_27075 [Chloroflexi bacterium]|nr:MAG: hypothetical protein DRJ03_27075 [Chloroflexota bacterium]
MTVVVFCEYTGEHTASFAPPSEITLGYIYVYNPNSFDLSNWPIYARFTDDNFDFSDNIHENGNNLRFRSQGGDLLDYFLGEWYNGTLGEAFIKVPSLPANTTVTIVMNYEPGSTADLSNFSAVSLQIIEDLYSEWRFCHPSNTTLFDSGGNDWDGEIVWVDEDYVNKTDAYFDIGFQTEMDMWTGDQWGGGSMPYRSITNSAPFTWEIYAKWENDCWGPVMNTYDAENGIGTYIETGGTDLSLGTCDGDCKTIYIWDLEGGTWYHIIGLFASDYVSLKVNGSNASTSISSNHTDFNPENEPLRIAIDSWDITVDYPLLVEYARVWERILTQSEIDQLRDHYSIATSRFPNKVCVLNWTEEKPQVFVVVS